MMAMSNLCLSREPEDRLHSPFFKASLSERWSGQKNDTISSGPIKWRYQLRFGEDDEKSRVVMFSEAVYW